MKPPSDSRLTLLDRFIHLIESVPGSDRLLLRVAVLAVFATGIWLAFAFNSQYSEETPTRGGSITEGIIGTPRFVNPALAITRADQDVAALIYSGLMKINQDGTLGKDVAELITVSEDGLIYNVMFKKDISFHDGVPLTARDFVYTIQLIQNPDMKSPLRGNWTDVVIEEINEYEINIVLKEAYAPFIENFTIGIMPAHSWSRLPIEQLPFSQLNTEPIGSGPFAVTGARRDTSGLINHYTLSAYRENTVDPKINTVELEFYPNEDALIIAVIEQELDATAYVPPTRMNEVLNGDYRLIEETLPRTFGVFFNQNKSTALRDAAAREALTAALNRDILIEKAFYGYGVPISGPTVFTQPELESEYSNGNIASTTPTERAKAILSEGGWLQNNLGLWEKQIDKETVTLSITLRTSNTPLFNSLSGLIADQWQAIGVEITTEQFEQAGLVQSVIRPRDFQALLFGHDISRSYDLYPVWHSSQQDDPGLNIAQYANVNVDALLEEARSDQSEESRKEALKEASLIIVEERPAIFIAQPTVTYLVSSNITVAEMQNLGRPADRFSNIADWHTQSDSLWPFFRKDM
jgi:peptide/nickel transport system substrate-binding protein